jgi:hypothetical protein
MPTEKNSLQHYHDALYDGLRTELKEDGQRTDLQPREESKPTDERTKE